MRASKSGNAHGIFLCPSQCSLSAGPGVCDDPVRSCWCCPGCLRHSSPLAVTEPVPYAADFYGCRSRESELLPSDAPRVCRLHTCHACASCVERSTAERVRPASGSYAAGKPSRRHVGGSRSIRRLAVRPILPWALGLLSGVSGAFSQHAGCASSGTPDRSSPRPSFCRPPSARGFPCDCCRTCLRVQLDLRSRAYSGCVGLKTSRDHSSLELRRRHPCRRRPFSVLGRSAPSESERFEAVTSVIEDVLPFRTRFLSEVLHRPV